MSAFIMGWKNPGCLFKTVLLLLTVCITAKLDAQQTSKVREVVVVMDPYTQDEFYLFLDSVTVELRHAHDDGRIASSKETITKAVLDAKKEILLRYDFTNDTTWQNFLRYTFRVKYYFKQGGILDKGWIESDIAMIVLDHPYVATWIELEADHNKLRSLKVKSWTATLEYTFLNDTLHTGYSVTVNTNDSIVNRKVMIPVNRQKPLTYKYTLRYTTNGGKDYMVKGENDMLLLFIDGTDTGTK